jgi:hypothetical protein
VKIPFDKLKARLLGKLAPEFEISAARFPPDLDQPVVIAGLDPAIHLLRKTFLQSGMDPRVKPEGDACE